MIKTKVWREAGPSIEVGDLVLVIWVGLIYIHPKYQIMNVKEQNDNTSDL